MVFAGVSRSPYLPNGTRKVPANFAGVAQLEERWISNPNVAGSIPVTRSSPHQGLPATELVGIFFPLRYSLGSLQRPTNPEIYR